jgi:hypothetical protein
MKGYVKNKSPIWAHVMKRVIGPGATVPLSELYAQYGKKHEIPEGEPFVEWLKEVKLRDKDRWQIVILDDNAIEEMPEPPEPTIVPESDDNLPQDKSKYSIEDVVGLSVRKAREVVPKISDVKLLNYALQEAFPKPGKDSLCNILRKRIRELQITAR